MREAGYPASLIMFQAQTPVIASSYNRFALERTFAAEQTFVEEQTSVGKRIFVRREISE